MSIYGGADTAESQRVADAISADYEGKSILAELAKQALNPFVRKEIHGTKACKLMDTLNESGYPGVAPAVT